MNNRTDGGSAFPSQVGNSGNSDLVINGEVVPPGSLWYGTGMTLRDYMAIHSTQPGVVEIAKAAGVSIDVHHFVSGVDPSGGRMSFNSWWLSLSLERQCELSAAVRYAQADAMLKARQS